MTGLPKDVVRGSIEAILYRRWSGMKDRCNAAVAVDGWRKSYGGRGIRVCDEWAKSFQSFRDWALNHGFSPDLTLERMNNDGNYEPDNCCWATRDEQRRNRQNSRAVLRSDGRVFRTTIDASEATAGATAHDIWAVCADRGRRLAGGYGWRVFEPGMTAEAFSPRASRYSSPRAIGVVRSDGAIFRSIRQACRETSGATFDALRAACGSGAEHAGFVWRFADGVSSDSRSWEKRTKADCVD